MAQQHLSLVHLVREPSIPSGSMPPLLLLLHGVGSYEGDLMGLAPYLDGRFFVVSPRAPHTLGPGSYAWYRVDFSSGRTLLDPTEPLRSRDLILRFIQECVETYRLDSRRVYLLGFSQGAIMSLGITLYRPETIAGTVLMSGRVLPDLVADMAPPDKLDGLPVLAVHGTEDEVLPIEEGRAMRALLEKLPVQFTYKEYEMGHQVTAESLSEVTSWLSARLDEQKNSS